MRRWAERRAHATPARHSRATDYSRRGEAETRGTGRADGPQEGPEHRHHGAHRRRQDHDDRADPVLHRDQLQDRRGPRRRRDDGLDGAGAGARHHDHVRRDDLLLAGHPDQHHRHPRPRRLHRRGRALAARPRRRRRRVRRQGGCRAPVRDGVAAGGQVQRPADLLRQQDGQARRRLLLHGAHDQRAPRRPPAAHPAADRVREQLRRRRRPRLQPRADLARRHQDGRGLHDRGRAGRHGRAGRGVPARSCSRRSPRPTRRCSRSSSAARSSPPRRSRARSARWSSPARSTRCCAARRSRTRACSPCSTPSSTTCPPRSTSRRSRATRSATRTRSSCASPTRRAVLGAGVQGRRAPVLRQAHLRPGVLGQGRHRGPGRQLDQGQEGAHREALPDARQQGEPGRRGQRGSHLRVHRPQGHDHGRHAERRRAPRRARVDDVPRAGHPRRHRAQDQGRPGEAGHGDPAPRGGGPDLPGPHRRGDGPDDHRRHGRAAPRHPRRPHAARVQGRGERRQAAGGVPRDDPQGRRQVRLHAQEADRRLRPVREDPGHHRAARHGRWLDVRVREQGHRWPRAARVHPQRRPRHPGRHAVRRRGRLPAWSA